MTIEEIELSMRELEEKRAAIKQELRELESKRNRLIAMAELNAMNPDKLRVLQELSLDGIHSAEKFGRLGG